VKNKPVYNIYAFGIVIFLLLPFIIQSLHGIYSNKHFICHSKHVHHYHKIGLDCSLYHVKIAHNSIDFSIEFSLVPLTIHNLKFTDNYKYKYLSPSSIKSYRAPPYFIV
jgi:hypothetical protein